MYGAGAWAGTVALRRTAPLLAQAETPADYTIRIAQLRLEIAPGKTVKTTGFNGRVPGELIRLREGQQVTIDVVNETDMRGHCALARARDSVVAGWGDGRGVAGVGGAWGKAAIHMGGETRRLSVVPLAHDGWAPPGSGDLQRRVRISDDRCEERSGAL